MAHDRSQGTTGKLLFDLLQTPLSIAKLAARITAHHRDASRRVRHAHRGISGVYPLAARSVCMKRLNYTIAGKLAR
jgi:hypothetical protein